jgi:hypothetical protein
MTFFICFSCQVILCIAAHIDINASNHVSPVHKFII